MPTFKHVLNNVFSVPVLEMTKKKLPTQRFVGLKKTVRNLSPMKENSQIIIDINRVLEDVPFSQQPQSVLPSYRQELQHQENNNENNTLEILIENESIEGHPEKKIDNTKINQNESISQGHISKLSICIQDNIERNLDFFSTAAAQQISHEEPKRNELPAEAIKNSLKTRTGRSLTNSAKTQKSEAPPPKTMIHSEKKGSNVRETEKLTIAEHASKNSHLNSRNPTTRKGQIIKSGQTRNSADYQTPKAKIKPKNKDPQTTYEKTQEDTLDLDFQQSPLLTREDKSDLENFLDETTRGQLSNIISAKSLQELNHKQSPRPELLKEKTDRIIPLDVQKGVSEEVMSFGRAGSGDGSGSGSREDGEKHEEAEEEEEEYDYSKNSHQSYEQKSPVSVKSRENPNIMVNDIISKAIQINDDGSELIEPLTEMKRSHSVDYRDDYHEILASQDVPLENSDYAAGRRQHSRSKSLGISRINLRNSRLENIPEETSQPATSNRETIFLAESLRSRRSPNQLQGEEDSNDHPLNIKQIKTSYSISLTNQTPGGDIPKVQSADSLSVSKHQQTEPVAFKQEARDAAVDIQGSSLKELEKIQVQALQNCENSKESTTPNHHHYVESFNGHGSTPPTMTIQENQTHQTPAPKVPEFLLKPTSETNITRKPREKSYEEQTSREVNDLFNVYLDSSNKKNLRSASPPVRRVQYSPDTNKLVQSYFLSKESDPSYDQTQIQGKTFNTSASQSNFYMRFSNFTRYNNTTHSKIRDSGDYFEVITSEGDYDSLKPIKERKYRECHVEGVRNEDSELDYSVNSDPTTTLFDKLMNRYMKAAQSPPKGSSMFEKNYEEYSQNANLKDLSLSNLDNQHTNNLEISDIAFLSNQFSPYKNQPGSLENLHQQSLDLSLLAIANHNNKDTNKFTSTTAAADETLASKNNTSHLPANMSSIQRSHDKIYVPKFGTPSSLAEPIQEASQVNGRSSPISLPKNMKSDPQSIQYFQSTSKKDFLQNDSSRQVYQIQHEIRPCNPQFLLNNNNTQKDVSYPEYSYNSPKSRNVHNDLTTHQKIEEIKKEAFTYKKSFSKGFTFLDHIDAPLIIKSEGRHRAASPEQLSPDFRSDDDLMEAPTLGAQKAFKGTPKKFDSKFLFSSPNKKSNY